MKNYNTLTLNCAFTISMASQEEDESTKPEKSGFVECRIFFLIIYRILVFGNLLVFWGLVQHSFHRCMFVNIQSFLCRKWLNIQFLTNCSIHQLEEHILVFGNLLVVLWLAQHSFHRCMFVNIQLFLYRKWLNIQFLTNCSIHQLIPVQGWLLLVQGWW